MKDERLVSRMEDKTNFSRHLKRFDGLIDLTDHDPQIYATAPMCDSGLSLDAFWTQLKTHLFGQRIGTDRRRLCVTSAASTNILTELNRTELPRLITDRFGIFGYLFLLHFAQLLQSVDDLLLMFQLFLSSAQPIQHSNHVRRHRRELLFDRHIVRFERFVFLYTPPLARITEHERCHVCAQQYPNWLYTRKRQTQTLTTTLTMHMYRLHFNLLTVRLVTHFCAVRSAIFLLCCKGQG